MRTETRSNKPISSIQQCPSWDANSHSASQKLPWPLWNPNSLKYRKDTRGRLRTLGIFACYSDCNSSTY